MAAKPNPIRETLEAIGNAIRLHMIFTLESQKYPLNRNKSELLKSLQVEVVQGRDKATGRFEGFSPNAKLLLYAKAYAEYLDSGRKPFTKKVPISALLRFIRNRNMRGRDRKTGRYFNSNQLAFMIQSSIYKNGIRGRRFIQPAYDHGKDLVELYLNDKFLDDVTYELNQYLISI